MADIISDGKVKVTWVTSLSSTTSPSAAELSAGTDLEAFITPDGLSIEIGDDSVDTSALNSTFSTTKAGRGTVSIEVTLKDQGRDQVPYSTFDNRPAGFLVVRRNIDSATAYASGQYVEVYSCTAGDHKIQPPAANEVAKFAVEFFSSTDPVLHATAAV